MEVCRGAMTEPIIIFDNVSKSYPLYHHITGGIKNFLFNLPKAVSSIKNSRYEALKNISFEVYKGETLGIIGKNGVGKSTTLGLIAGVLKPSKGNIIVKGRVSPLLELGAGFHPELTGRENIILNGVLMGLTRAEVLRKIDEIIEFSELRDFINQPIRTYSSGMLARLGFSVVAHLNPEILLIDEVLAVGDIEFQKKCIDKMMEFKKSGVTMVFVSHSMEDVARICDRAMWIENHNIKMIGEPKEIVEDYRRS
jgi:lipopolysaccharide transport system ATP-binding protein